MKRSFVNLYVSLNIIRVDKVKKDEIGGVCCTHGIDEKSVQHETLKDKDFQNTLA